jgi:hypothetical protein
MVSSPPTLGHARPRIVLLIPNLLVQHCAAASAATPVALRTFGCGGRAQRGVGAQRPLECPKTVPAKGAFNRNSSACLESAKLSNTVFSQFHEPRSARIARHSAVNQAPSPRSNVEFQELLHSSAWLGHQRQNAWPNPSFELTHYSKALGPCGAFVYHAPHGPIPLLPWAAQFQR